MGDDHSGILAICGVGDEHFLQLDGCGIETGKPVPVSDLLGRQVYAMKFTTADRINFSPGGHTES